METFETLIYDDYLYILYMSIKSMYILKYEYADPHFTGKNQDLITFQVSIKKLK